MWNNKTAALVLTLFTLSASEAFAGYRCLTTGHYRRGGSQLGSDVYFNFSIPAVGGSFQKNVVGGFIRFDRISEQKISIVHQFTVWGLTSKSEKYLNVVGLGDHFSISGYGASSELDIENSQNTLCVLQTPPREAVAD